MVQALAQASLSTAFSASVSYRQGADGEQSLNVSLALVSDLATPNGDQSDAFSIDISATSKASKQLQDLQKAVNTLAQGAAEAKAFQKAAAAKKLEDAIRQLQLLKLIGDPATGAKEAARLAKQIGDAASAYSGTSQSGGTATDALLKGNQQADNAEAANAQKAVAAASGGGADTTSGDGIDPAAGGSTSGSASDTTAVDAAAAAVASSPADAKLIADLASSPQDFFSVAEAALGEIRKYLNKQLAILRASPDKKAHDAANQASDVFDKAVSDTVTAAGSAGAVDLTV